MTERRFVLVDFRYTNDVVGHVRLYEAGCTYAMRRGLAHAAAKRELVAVEQPVDWMPPSIFRPPEVMTELVVYLPHANMTMDASGASNNYQCTKIVVNTFTTNGSVNLNFAQTNDCTTVGMKQWNEVPLHLAQ